MSIFLSQRINLLAFFLLPLVMILLVNACKSKDKPYQKLEGRYLDKSYTIQYKNDSVTTISKGIDSILICVTSQLDLNNEQSSLSRFNNAKDTFYLDPIIDAHFIALWDYSKTFMHTSQGILDPSMAPLFEFYGDGYSERKALSKKDTLIIAKLLAFKSLATLSIHSESKPSYIVKPYSGVKLSFAAIQTGYVVDNIASFLDLHKIRNYYVDIDGKCQAKGMAEDKSDWTYGVNRPTNSGQKSVKELPLIISNKGIATSGSYTNAKESIGNKYAFIIDPKTGYSRLSDVLSVTVIANDCITADAYATTFITLGLEKSIQLIKKLKGVGACFIYDIEGDGNFEFQISEGFSKNYLDNEQQ